MALERMTNGLLILNGENCLADLNPAARELLALPADRIVGREAAHVLRAYPDILRLLEPERVASTEMTLAGEPYPRRIHVHASPLSDVRGLKAGWLLLLQDVTDQVRARRRVHRGRISGAIDRSGG